MGTFPALGADQPRRPLGLQPPKFPSIFLVSFRSVALGAAPPSQHWGKDRPALAEATKPSWPPALADTPRSVPQVRGRPGVLSRLEAGREGVHGR